jgi:SpoIID/LytB domain protein
MEKFSVCWDDKDYAYLQPLPDSPAHLEGGKCFCDTQDKEILGQVLNNYDQETTDFYRWTQVYGVSELSELVARKSGTDIGRILRMEALERGESGRICKLKIVGSDKTLIVGKELEIRKILSESHLKSSAFDVEMTEDEVILHGKGWGHGVGLCQIGAAVRASEGYTYEEILKHYYPGTSILV